MCISTCAYTHCSGWNEFCQVLIFDFFLLRSAEKQVCSTGNIQKTEGFSPPVSSFVGYALWWRWHNRIMNAKWTKKIKKRVDTDRGMWYITGTERKQTTTGKRNGQVDSSKTKSTAYRYPEDDKLTSHSECRNQVRRIVHWTTDKPLAVFIAATVGEAQMSLAVVIESSLTTCHAWFGKEESQMALILKLI